MNDLLMSGNLSERLSLTGLTSAIITLEFADKENLTGQFVSIAKESKLCIIMNVDEQDKPFKYFGLSANKAIINTGSETLIFTGELQVLKIEKESNYLLSIGAETYERNIRNESSRNS